MLLLARSLIQTVYIFTSHVKSTARQAPLEVALALLLEKTGSWIVKYAIGAASTR
jgi:hypothetical protein